VVREYLYLEFKDLKIPQNLFNFERIVDDFVFLCFLVGNDFLPHLPSLSIREGALDAIIFIYKNLLPSLGGYLTDGKGGLLRSNVDVFFKELSKTEEAFFHQHEKNAKFNEERRKQDEARDNEKLVQEMQAKGQHTADATQEPVKWRNKDKLQPVPTDEKKMTAAELEAHVKEQIAKSGLSEAKQQEQVEK
jgi:5'-3' exoribonuclease 2